MPHRQELSDAEWERIAPLLPPLGTKSTYYKDHRCILNGLLFRHHTEPGQSGSVVAQSRE